jgi:hypothetical protein
MLYTPLPVPGISACLGDTVNPPKAQLEEFTASFIGTSSKMHIGIVISKFEICQYISRYIFNIYINTGLGENISNCY